MALVSEFLYQHLLDWLCPAMEAEYKRLYSKGKDGGKLRGLGKCDKNVYQGRVDRLRAIVRNLICEDKMKRFLSDGSKSAIYAFNGVCFVRVEDREIFLKELLKRAFIELDLGEKYNDEYPAKAIAMSCLDTISSSDKYLYRPNRRYVAFRNLVYDLEKFKAIAPKIDQCPAIVLDLEYKDPKDLDIECGQKFKLYDNPRKIWETKIFGQGKNDQLPGIIPNPQVADAFQQWCGSLLADKSRFKVEYTCMLVGPGSNGKSVLANAILNVFGEQYFSCFSLRQLFKDSDRNVNIAALQGKIANFIDDVEDRKMSDDGFKTFASGGEFQGRVPYDKRPIKVKAPPLLCCANSVPETDDDSFGAHRRRLVLLTTQHRFVGEERDTSLTYKLSQPEARMYIFHWIVEGYRKFVKNGGDIVLKPEVAKAQEVVMAGSNNMRRWWAENDYEAVKEYDKDCWRSLAELYEEYKAFAEAEGSKQHARPELSAMLAQKGCFKQRLQVGYGFCLRKSKAEYHNYLLSEQWGDIRRQVIERDGYRCRICEGGAHGSDANVHHLIYQNIGNEDLVDLVNLCPTCHDEIHREVSKFKGEPTWDNLCDFLWNYENRSRAFIEILGMTVARLSQQDKDGTTEQMIMDISECIKQ